MTHLATTSSAEAGPEEALDENSVRPERLEANCLRAPRKGALAAAMAGSDPGMGFDRDGGEPVVRKLRHFRLVLVDNRGSGLSDLPAGSFRVADMAGGVVAVLDHAGVRTATLWA